MSVYSEEAARQFWTHAIIGDDPSACWDWRLSEGKRQYGHVRVQRLGHCERWLAHRLSWVIHFGPIPEGLFVCHHCDNPRCANPKHLFLSDHKGNMADMWAKGRGACGDRSSFRLYPELYYGERHWVRRRPELIKRGEDVTSARLTEAQAQWILDNVRGWGDAAEAARRFGVHGVTVHDIVAGRTWRHLKGERRKLGPRPDDTAERFWAKVDRSNSDGCWPWLGGRSKNGNGVFLCDGHSVTAQSMAYRLSIGPVPKGRRVRRTCSTVSCCQPAHLRLS